MCTEDGWCTNTGLLKKINKYKKCDNCQNTRAYRYCLYIFSKFKLDVKIQQVKLSAIKNRFKIQ